MKVFYFLSVLFVFFTSTSFAQEINKDPFNNRIVLKHYTVDELTIMKNDYPEKFKTVKYKLIHSFVIDEEGQNHCENFNPALFDVSLYENERHPSRRVEIFEPICGIKITLLSQRELDLLILNDGKKPLPADKNKTEN